MTVSRAYESFCVGTAQRQLRQLEENADALRRIKRRRVKEVIVDLSADWPFEFTPADADADANDWLLVSPTEGGLPSGSS